MGRRGCGGFARLYALLESGDAWTCLERHRHTESIRNGFDVGDRNCHHASVLGDGRFLSGPEYGTTWTSGNHEEQASTIGMAALVDDFVFGAGRTLHLVGRHAR